jgi:uncharacterized protein
MPLMAVNGDHMRRLIPTARSALIVGLLALSSAANAAPPPCRGQNMLDEMKTAEPVVYARVMSAARQTVNAEALFWRIEKPGIAPSYLLGTVHVSDPRVTTLSSAVSAALTSAKAVALEIADMSPAAMQAGAGSDPSLMISTNRGLGNLISQEEFAMAKTVTDDAAVGRHDGPDPASLRANAHRQRHQGAGPDAG